jgi:GTP-binding protein
MEKRIPTSELNAALEEDLFRLPPRSRSGKEVRIKYVSQVRARPPVFAFFCNDPSLIDDNYRRYLENRIRERFGFPGVPITISFKRKS